MSNNSVKGFAERINSLKDEARQTAEDIRSVFEEAKNAGINVKALREAMRRMRLDVDVRSAAEQYELEL